jgi:hypothetical protein
MNKSILNRNVIRLILTPPPAEALGGASIGKSTVNVTGPLA